MTASMSGQNKHRWTAFEEGQLLALKQAGMAEALIAAHFGVSVAAVSNKFTTLMRRFIVDAPKLPYAGCPVINPHRAPLHKQPWQRSGERWSDAENEKLLTARGRGDNFTTIAPTLNRTRWACKVQYHSLMRGTAAPPQNIDARISKRQMLRQQIVAARITPEPVSLTAAFCNDPPPGRSALDKKKSGTVDDLPIIHDRYGNPMWRRPITLPTKPFRVSREKVEA